jgi:hypothetical protein
MILRRSQSLLLKWGASFLIMQSKQPELGAFPQNSFCEALCAQFREAFPHQGSSLRNEDKLPQEHFL